MLDQLFLKPPVSICIQFSGNVILHMPVMSIVTSIKDNGIAAVSIFWFYFDADGFKVKNV